MRGSGFHLAWKSLRHKTRQKFETGAGTPEQIVKDIRRATGKHNSAEEKIPVVLEGLFANRPLGNQRRWSAPSGLAVGRGRTWPPEQEATKIKNTSGSSKLAKSLEADHQVSVTRAAEQV